MKLVDSGTGAPVVLVPGIQGRWEWMRPAVDALARRCRVITFSLADERSCGGQWDDRRGFWCYVDQIAEAMDAAALERATVCGVSYGGLVAAAFAARHPERVAGLVLVSTPPPSWTPDARVRFYLRAPRLLSPIFCAASLRLYREIAAAVPGRLASLEAAAAHGLRALRHMFSPSRMARRVRLLAGLDLAGEIAAVRTPTLIVTGEDHLDRVVAARRTREFLALLPQARAATLPNTGHLGLITRPDAFANLVAPFVERAAADAEQRRRIG